jgi:probable phosphomutase (TIGR03848 family)
MPLLYLVRHGSNDYLGKGLAGRLPGVCLNEKGRAEAARIAETLSSAGIQRIFSSPLDRCRQTAEPLAQRLSLSIEYSDEILEVDFGDWSGKSLTELDASDQWKLWNTYRSGTRAPNGETILEIQARMVAFLEKLTREARSTSAPNTFAIFSHGDPIRAALCHYLGIPLDFLTRLEVSPGSYSILRLEPSGPEVLAINRLPL